MTTTTGSQTDTRRRATRWLWALVTLAVVLTGALSHELTASAGPLTGAAVAVTGLLTVLMAIQATRLWLALSGRRPPTPGASSVHN